MAGFVLAVVLAACAANVANSSSVAAASSAYMPESSASVESSETATSAAVEEIGGNLNDTTMNEIEIMTVDGHTLLVIIFCKEEKPSALIFEKPVALFV